MLCWTLNIIYYMQHNTLKRKPFHVFNNNFEPKLLAIVSINSLFILRKSFFFVKFLSVCCCLQVKFTLLNQCRMINSLHMQLYILSKNISKYLSCIIVVRWCKLCVQNITDGGDFQGIISRRDYDVARYYKIIII